MPAKRPSKISGWRRESDKIAEALGFVQCEKCGERKRSDSFYQNSENKAEKSKKCKACEGYYQAYGLSRPKQTRS